jgi:hypothetical protein
MRQARAISFGFVLLAASVAAPPARACSCPRNPSADGILAAATAVFTGTVRAVETIGPGLSRTTFVVTEPFKGAQPGEILNVQHPSGPAGTCGVRFTYGATYTLAASLERGALWTSQCSTWMFAPSVGLSGDLIARLRALRRRR